MPFDADLILDSGQTVVATGNNAAIQVEGGWLAWARLVMGTVSGGGTTCDVYIQASIDNGSNYYMIGKFQQMGPSLTTKELAIPVYIPRWATSDATLLTYVRARYVVAGGAPSYAVTYLRLDPMVSLAVRSIDEKLGIGAAALVAAL